MRTVGRRMQKMPPHGGLEAGPVDLVLRAEEPREGLGGCYGLPCGPRKIC